MVGPGESGTNGGFSKEMEQELRNPEPRGKGCSEGEGGRWKEGREEGSQKVQNQGPRGGGGGGGGLTHCSCGFRQPEVELGCRYEASLVDRLL